MADVIAALEAPLVEKADGNPAAVARARALVNDHFDFIWRLLRRLGVPLSEVDDAAQEVFWITAKRLASVEEGRERAFLYGTALRTASTLRRNQSRRDKWMDTDAGDSASTARAPDEELERRQALAFLDEVLSSLPGALREIFVLCDIEEFTAPEAASILNLPLGTIASRLRRARKDFSDRVRRLQTKESRRP
jgi:RNA polymerase sigma-70 factor (ECF subfamily)